MDTNINFDSEQSQRLFELLKGKIPDLPPKYLSKKLSITSHGYIEDGLAEAKEVVVNYNNPVVYSYEDWEKDVIGVQQVIEGDSTIYVNLNHFVKYLPDGGLFYHTFYRIKYHAEMYPQDILKIKAIQAGYVTGLAEQLYNELVEIFEKTIKAQPDPELKVKILKRHQVAVNFILENEELPNDKKTQETLNKLPHLNWKWILTYGHEKKHRWGTPPFCIKFSHNELINEYKRLINSKEEYQPNAEWVRFSYLDHSIHSAESVMLAYYKFRDFLFSEHVNQHPLPTTMKPPSEPSPPSPQRTLSVVESTEKNTHAKTLLNCIEPHSTILFWNQRKPEKMPYAFRKMNDNFSNWFDDQDQREEIAQRFENELSDGLVTDIYLNKIRQSWSHKSYYQDLITWYTEQHREVWKNSLSKQTEISKAYPFLQEWINEGRTLEEEPRSAWEKYLCLANEANEASTNLKVLKSYCEAALWFIRSSKNIVESWEGTKITTPPTTSTDTNEETNLTHAQICLLYIYTKRPINKNNAQEIAEQYNYKSGQKLADKYEKMKNNLTERISPKFAVRDIEKVIKLLSEQSLLSRANDELKQAKKLKGVD